MTKLREAVVVFTPPGVTRGRILKRFTTVRAAEKFIEKCEERNPEGVHRGDYSIDATPTAEAEYQRLRNGRVS